MRICTAIDLYEFFLQPFFALPSIHGHIWHSYRLFYILKGNLQVIL